jgi:hypothetical protein
MFGKMVLTREGGILEGCGRDGYVLFEGTASVFTSRRETKPREISLPIACRPGGDLNSVSCRTGATEPARSVTVALLVTVWKVLLHECHLS